MSRPRIFDSGYHMMWSLLDGVTPAEIAAEIPRLEKAIREDDMNIRKINDARSVRHSKLRVLEELTERHHKKKLQEEFRLTEDHKKVIRSINWEYHDPYNYHRLGEVCEILEYKKPNDDYSDEQYEAARKIIEEIPIAVNRFFGGK